MFTDFCFPLNSSCKTVHVSKLQNVYIYCVVYVHKFDNKSPNIIKTESPKKRKGNSKSLSPAKQLGGGGVVAIVIFLTGYRHFQVKTVG